MRSILMIICLTLAFTIPLARSYAGEVKKGAAVGEYNAAKQYDGPFKAKGLYYRGQGTFGWTPIGKFFTGPVTCSDALGSLGKTGYWKGHLKRDGSCGPKAEPQSWITGNRMNYNIAAGLNEEAAVGSGNDDE